MFDIRAKETIIVNFLKAFVGCEVCMANEAVPAPKYPYISYTIINLVVANNGTYSEYSDGTKRKDYQQVWSFTVHSNNDTESKEKALLAHIFFSELGVISLLDNGISTQLVGGITNRDNILTVGYQYSNGFDVTFSMVSEITPEQQDGIESIESVAIGNTQIDVQDPEKIIEDLTRQRDILMAEVENLNKRIVEASAMLENTLEGGEIDG